MLTYAGGDKLYIPVENLDVLSRFGAENEGVALDRLGGEAWQKRRAKLKERIREIAHELLKTAALRALRTAPALVSDPASFAPSSTASPGRDRGSGSRHRRRAGGSGQRQADGPSGLRRCRLRQDRGGFARRFRRRHGRHAGGGGGAHHASGAPAPQELFRTLRRFPAGGGPPLAPRARKEASATRAGLAEGKVDLIVGTHALLAKSVNFKRLGLVIVDEEQRFGVTHKERLKQLRADVHMLTLTATPIPRTLQMAMSGLRELSTIQTPPVDRLAVRTYVMEWDEMVMREALLREHHRGGQSFIVVPRISDMAEVEEWLRTYVPEVKYVSAHGQMAASEVEERMSAFYERKYDVLLSTTIVESGIDIPSANTIIIHRADRFGLAQLYQLRGRVGRSKLRAYAYLTTAAGKGMTDTAEKRLKVLGDLDSLGAGFQLASHDLDIRGAGTCLVMSSRAISARSASSCTNPCWKTRSSRPRRARSALSATAPRA
jgi:transcription-repair coupling factor (superfamily II helicase)